MVGVLGVGGVNEFGRLLFGLPRSRRKNSSRPWRCCPASFLMSHARNPQRPPTPRRQGASTRLFGCLAWKRPWLAGGRPPALVCGVALHTTYPPTYPPRMHTTGHACPGRPRHPHAPAPAVDKATSSSSSPSLSPTSTHPRRHNHHSQPWPAPPRPPPPPPPRPRLSSSLPSPPTCSSRCFPTATVLNWPSPCRVPVLGRPGSCVRAESPFLRSRDCTLRRVGVVGPALWLPSHALHRLIVQGRLQLV